jgi:hypothetical protein
MREQAIYHGTSRTDMAAYLCKHVGPLNRRHLLNPLQLLPLLSTLSHPPSPPYGSIHSANTPHHGLHRSDVQLAALGTFISYLKASGGS